MDQTDRHSATERLRSIDILRGVAILLVLAVHSPHVAPGGWREHPWFFPSLLLDFGYLGVPLFIAISGFCIHRIAAINLANSGSYRFDWIAFWKRRFIRLYPPYLAAVIFSVVAATWLHSQFESTRPLYLDLATHLLLVHNLTEQYAASLGNGPLWSLGMEEQLYALYPLLLLGFVRLNVRKAIYIVAALTLAWRLSVPFLMQLDIGVAEVQLGSWYKWPLSYWFNWALGAIAVEAWCRNLVLPRWTRSLRWALALFAGAALFGSTLAEFLLATKLPLAAYREVYGAHFVLLHNLSEMSFVVGFFCVLNWAVEREVARVRFDGALWGSLAWLGRISYSVYLTHRPILYVLTEHVPVGAKGLQWPLTFLLGILISIAFGWVFFQLVERWFLKGKWPWLDSRPKAVSALG